MSYNIRYGGAGREPYLADVIGDAAPDIVILQEATQPQVIGRLAEMTGMETWAAQPGYSLAFMSRLPIAKYSWHSAAGVRRPFLEIVVDKTDLQIFGLHLSAIHSNWTERRRVRELRVLLKLIEQHRQGFHVVAGDFNTLAPGELLDISLLPIRLRPFVWLSGGRVRWETIQIMLNANYIDGYRMLYPEDKGYTFPTFNPHLRLDYVFLHADYGKKLKACKVISSSPAVVKASDHFPLQAYVDVG